MDGLHYDPTIIRIHLHTKRLIEICECNLVIFSLFVHGALLKKVQAFFSVFTFFLALLLYHIICFLAIDMDISFGEERLISKCIRQTFLLYHLEVLFSIRLLKLFYPPVEPRFCYAKAYKQKLRPNKSDGVPL